MVKGRESVDEHWYYCPNCKKAFQAKLDLNKELPQGLVCTCGNFIKTGVNN
jgi:hypothetical protein